jgi:hypothetical protein
LGESKNGLIFPPLPFGLPSPPLLKKMNQTQFTNNNLSPPLPSPPLQKPPTKRTLSLTMDKKIDVEYSISEISYKFNVLSFSFKK